ncbi:hypothetical protein Tco_1217858 [Tanacetum coccineum]
MAQQQQQQAATTTTIDPEKIEIGALSSEANSKPRVSKRRFEAIRAELQASLGAASRVDRIGIVGFNLEGATAEWLKVHLQRELLVSNPTTLGDVFLLARNIEARFDDQAALMAGKVKVLNWVRQAIDAESTSDNDARDQAGELETKMLVDGKQDEKKVVVVADEQNSDEPDVLEGNGVIGNENNKGVYKEVQYSVYTLLVLIPFMKHLNDKYIKKNIKPVMQRRL